ncbi:MULTISPECIES: LysR family transcriptional regulator [Pantoea]|jgi:DNA-binding transcriptional LysR family regulator|uniref:LysR family transcriptional regulator n=1 Tax=Pantoea TaxID=53335 RepID=UPI000EA15F34|nr:MULTISPECIES: LysR family transcriptional regulator [Pantoea]MBZ6387302.1 LysR family transcriptional regulator [Pantoea piersonii]MBZ6402362.1 LysR family transcriptional regulator [Pantoea piersonii]MBZ6407444.1 LysR family transcriptional regulator [Pantoea piersonii]MBZ6426774.1 LysR family transcriptional regulator [Pantoea piersonii]NYB02149.1 LysR family transcriptional regulator [Pantoea piersonii]
MDLKRLHYFCTIAEQGSISKAARLLNMAQPPLGKRLQELEEEIGSPLFLRTPRKMVLTEAGTFLYRQACDILSKVNSLKRETITIATRKKRVVNIGVSYLYLRFFNPVLMDYYRNRPEWDINVVVSDSSHLEEMLLEHTLDIALMQLPHQHKQWHVRELEPIDTVVVLSTRYAENLAGKALKFSDLNGIPLILLHRIGGEGTYEILRSTLFDQLSQVNISMKVSEPKLIMEMMELGFNGAAFIPRSEYVPSAQGRYLACPLVHPLAIYTPAIVTLSTARDRLLWPLEHELPEE